MGIRTIVCGSHFLLWRILSDVSAYFFPDCLESRSEYKSPSDTVPKCINPNRLLAFYARTIGSNLICLTLRTGNCKCYLESPQVGKVRIRLFCVSGSTWHHGSYTAKIVVPMTCPIAVHVSDVSTTPSHSGNLVPGAGHYLLPYQTSLIYTCPVLPGTC